MEKPASSRSSRGSHFRNIINIVLIITLSFPKITEAGSIVKYLPGYPGILPFELETGYIGVDESEDVQLFYYFTKSESVPESDPVILWLTGGPGCSGISSLLYEIGPLGLVESPYNGSLPRLKRNPFSWTKFASIIFLDQPVGTGFSYARTAKASHSSDLQVSNQIYEFLRKWMVYHPEFISNPVYLGGLSYTGFIVPLVAQHISDGNEAGIEPKIDLKGYLEGNAWTRLDEKNYRIPYAHRMGLISDELYQSLKLNCNGQYETVDTGNALCLQSMQAYNQLISGINLFHILDQKCSPISPDTVKKSGNRRRTAIEMVSQKIPEHTPTECYNSHDQQLVNYWAIDESVQEAIHIRKGSIGEWNRCSKSILYTKTLTNVVPYHANLSIQGYRSLVFSGDHDMVFPHIGTQAWIKSLNYQIIDDWRQWQVGGQVAGYTRTYANGMTFATIKGAGHVSPMYKPEECLAMFKRWISSEPL